MWRHELAKLLAVVLLGPVLNYLFVISSVAGTLWEDYEQTPVPFLHVHFSLCVLLFPVHNLPSKVFITRANLPGILNWELLCTIQRV